MTKRFVLSMCLVTLGVAACSEASDDATGGSGASGSETSGAVTGSNATGATSGKSASQTAAASGSASTGSGEGGLAINEISAQGDDYIELFNAGTDSVDLSNLRVADEDSPGVPKIDDAITFPEGTNLAPGGFLFILAGLDAPGTGPQTMCDPGPSPCFQAGFGLSKDGDGVYILAEDDSIMLSAEYPGALPDGATWSRLPDGTGDFANGSPTPGAANSAL